MIKIINEQKVQQYKIKTINKKVKVKGRFTFEGSIGTFMFQNNTIYMGTKSKKKLSGEDWRVLGFKLNSYIHSLSIKKVSIELPKLCGEFLEGVLLGNYKFDKYKSKKAPIQKISLYTSNRNITKQIKKAKIKVEAQCLTRNWVNTAPEDAYSKSIAKAITKHFKDSDVKVEVYGEKKLKSFGMNGHLAVNRASRHEAMTVKLTYEPKNTPKEHIILVGKGLTYDSGGLSLKPSNYMVDMKCDKAGAMTVWGIMDMVKNIGSENKITCYLGLAENMIDGSAYKNDDVITFMNGVTAEIKNTDAEGRVVLFDNICLAQKENKKFDKLFTFATLTGSAVMQFGEEATAMVGFNDKIKKEIKKAGNREGEIFVDAVFHKYMLNGVDNPVADISNTGSANMGCQKAGLFLTNALKEKNKQKYLHLDIAGPAFASKGFGTNISGGTGFAVRTFGTYLVS